MGGFLRNYSPELKLQYKSGLQWAAMGAFFKELPPDKNCIVGVVCVGLQWEGFGGITHPPPPPVIKIAKQERAARGCNGRILEELFPLIQIAM